MSSADHRYAAYAWPSSTHSVSDSFQDHVTRGSVNPGTDYTAPWGTPVYSVWDGTVAGIVTTNYGSGGRMIYVDQTDDTSVDYLHLSQINVNTGDNVSRGQLIGYSGASGYAEEFYYGAHLHISIRSGHGWHAMNHGNYDFDATIRSQIETISAGGNAVPIEEEEMAAAVLIRDPSGGIYLCSDDGSFEAIVNMDEVAALQATGAIRPGTNGQPWIQLSDNFIRDLRKNIAARKRYA